jgi:hypothetical protein
MIKYIYNSNKWSIISISILIIALSSCWVSGFRDTFNWDAYGLMIGLENKFPEYNSDLSYILPQRIHYWISFRLFGSNLFGFIFSPLILMLFSFVIIYIGIKKYFHNANSIIFVSLLILAFNAHLKFRCGYPLITYAGSFLVSALLFFLYLRLSSGIINKKKWLWIFFILIPAAFFSNIPVLVPFATGIFSLIFIRYWYKPLYRSFFLLWKSIKELLLLVVFPFVFLVVYKIQPFINLGPIKRPEMASLFFSTSEFSQDTWILGIIKYSFERSIKLIIQFFPKINLVIGEINIGYIISFIFLFMFCILLLYLYIKFFKRNLQKEISFTLIFFTITFLAILSGGLIGVFPFGILRYASFLLLPAAILSGYGFSLIIKWVLQKIRIKSKILPIAIALLIFILGSFNNLKIYKHNLLTKNRNHKALQLINISEVDLVLLSEYQRPVVTILAPEAYAKSYSIGWGTYFGHGDDGGISKDFIDQLKLKNVDGSLKSVLLIAPQKFEELYPSWVEFLSRNNFKIRNNIEAPNIYAYYFIQE